MLQFLTLHLESEKREQAIDDKIPEKKATAETRDYLRKLRIARSK
jgi:hypothetical protein